MKKGLQERFARFHASFPLDDVYLGLPQPIRNATYLYLLALNGHQRAKEADAYVPMEVARQLALMMRVDCARALRALEVFVDKDGKQRVIEVSATHVFLVQYAKWQDTPEEIAELRAARSEAGQKGALVGWEKKRSQGAQQTTSKPPASAGQVLQQIPAEREIEREGESLIASPNPQVRDLDAITEGDPATELLLWWHGFIGRQISEDDRIAAPGLLEEYPRLGLAGIKARIVEHAEWRIGEEKDPIRTLQGYRYTLAREEIHLADRGVLKPRGVAS